MYRNVNRRKIVKRLQWGFFESPEDSETKLNKVSESNNKVTNPRYKGTYSNMCLK